MKITAKSTLVHLSLFLLSFITTTIAGVQWLNKDPFEISNFIFGFPYGLLLLAFLSCHELGHYVAARYHGVEVTLPYFIPLPSFFGIAPFGTLGAVIRIRSTVPSRRALFDIGAAGPLCGFVVSMAILVIGLRTLPPLEYLYGIHPEYSQLATLPQGGLTFGNSLLFTLLKETIPPVGAFIPPMNEMYHYPFLCVGWFGLFVTALNLIPIGQLDGGHIARSVFVRHYNQIGQSSLVLLVILGTIGVLPLLGIPARIGWIGWLIWGAVLAFALRAKGQNSLAHEEIEPIGELRQATGWICALILVATFAPTPFLDIP